MGGGPLGRLVGRPWVVVFVGRKGSGWLVRGDALGTRPMPTRRAKGRGLVLEWPAAVVERPSGQFPELHLLLRNASPGIWEDGTVAPSSLLSILRIPRDDPFRGVGEPSPAWV